MSRGVMLYSVPPERLRQALGSRASALKAGLKLGSDPQSQATARFIDEGSVADCDAGVRIHAFERLCEYLGRSLPNSSVSPVKLDFLEKVDLELERLSFCLSLSKLIYGGGPLSLPPADDFPTVGHAEARLVELADEQRRAGLLKSGDEEIASVFAELSTARSIRADPAHSAGHSQNHAPPEPAPETLGKPSHILSTRSVPFRCASVDSPCR